MSSALPSGSATLESSSTELVVLLDRVNLRNNTATRGSGGGLFVDSHQGRPGVSGVTLVHVDSEVSGNRAGGSGGGISADGSAVVLSGLNVTGNAAAAGKARVLTRAHTGTSSHRR